MHVNTNKILEQIDNIIKRDVVQHQTDWFSIDRLRFIEKHLDHSIIIGTRKTGCDILVIGDSERESIDMARVFGNLGNTRFYYWNPFPVREKEAEVKEVDFRYAFTTFAKFLPQDKAIRFDYEWELVNI